MSAVMKAESYRTSSSIPPLSQGIGVAYIAMQIAMRYRDRTPTVDELRTHYGMSRANAYRWRGAFLAAKGEA